MDRPYNKSDGKTKVCPKCGLTKVLDAFYTHTLNGKKRRSWCKVCEAEFYDKDRRKIKRHLNYLKNKEKWIKENKLRVQKNRAKRNEYMRKYMMLYYLRKKTPTSLKDK